MTDSTTASVDCHADVATALAAGFPDRDAVAVEDAGPSWNEGNRTVRVSFAEGDPVYLKVASDGDGTRVARERGVIEYVRATTDVPVPTVVAADSDAAVPYLATAPTPGETLLAAWPGAESEACRDLLGRVGRAFATVHARRFDSHGHVLGGDADGLDLDTAPWPDVLADTVARTRDRVADGRFAHYFGAVLDAIEAERDLLASAPATLLHGDPAHPNCVVVGEQVGFLDWELAHVGDPVRELRRARRQLVKTRHVDGPDALVAAMHDGYREVAGSLPPGFDERAPLYDAVTYLGTVGFFERWGPEADRPTEELAAEVDAEMQRRLDAI